jgi:hypothetical protein
MDLQRGKSIGEDKVNIATRQYFTFFSSRTEDVTGAAKGKI